MLSSTISIVGGVYLAFGIASYLHASIVGSITLTVQTSSNAYGEQGYNEKSSKLDCHEIALRNPLVDKLCIRVMNRTT